MKLVLNKHCQSESLEALNENRSDLAVSAILTWIIPTTQVALPAARRFFATQAVTAALTRERRPKYID
jgi:hypothetical protein